MDRKRQNGNQNQTGRVMAPINQKQPKVPASQEFDGYKKGGKQ